MTLRALRAAGTTAAHVREMAFVRGSGAVSHLTLATVHILAQDQ